MYYQAWVNESDLVAYLVAMEVGKNELVSILWSDVRSKFIVITKKKG